MGVEDAGASGGRGWDADAGRTPDADPHGRPRWAVLLASQHRWRRSERGQVNMENPTQMQRRPRSGWFLWLCVVCAPLGVHADSDKAFAVYDRVRGELSPGTDAPKLETMMNAIRSASPTALTAVLE